MLKRLSKESTTVYIEPFLGAERLDKLQDNLYIGQLHGNGMARQIVGAAPEQIAESIRALAWRLGVDEIILLFDFPYWSPVLTKLSPYKVLYNCMDDYAGFGDLKAYKDMMHAREKFLFEKSDLVYCTAKGLYDKAKQYTKNVVLIPNGCEPNHFEVHEVTRLEDLPYGKIVGYVGCIAEWFDQEALAYMADKLPYWNFVLLGHASVNVDVLTRRKNIYLYGETGYQKIPIYMNFFDVAIIPFNSKLDLIKNCNPVKVYEYLAAGKSIVSSAMPEVLNMTKEGKNILISDRLEDWDIKILEAYDMAQRKEFSAKQKASVVNDTWDIRANQLLNEMRKIGC